MAVAVQFIAPDLRHEDVGNSRFYSGIRSPTPLPSLIPCGQCAAKFNGKNRCFPAVVRFSEDDVRRFAKHPAVFTDALNDVVFPSPEARESLYREADVF